MEKTSGGKQSKGKNKEKGLRFQDVEHIHPTLLPPVRKPPVGVLFSCEPNRIETYRNEIGGASQAVVA